MPLRDAPQPSSSRAPESCRLHPRATVTTFAEACRNTALDLLNGRGWGKAELAAWLAGPYRALTRVAYAPPERGPERILEVLAQAFATKPVRAVATTVSLTEDRVAGILRHARRDVVRTVEDLADEERGVGFAFGILGSGHVLRAHDRDGGEGFVPADAPRMRLAERVTSLLAVDYLLRPEDYGSQVAICAHCGIVAFDARLREVGACDTHTESLIPDAPSMMEPRVRLQAS